MIGLKLGPDEPSDYRCKYKPKDDNTTGRKGSVASRIIQGVLTAWKAVPFLDIVSVVDCLVIRDIGICSYS